MKNVNKTLILLVALFASAHAFAEESVPEKIGNGIKNGAMAAEHGIRKGGEATVKGLKTAGRWVGRKLHAGSKSSVKESDSK